MSSVYAMLQKVRECPEIFMGEKSLEALIHFWNGYVIGVTVGTWEQATGRDFFEHYDEAICSHMHSEDHIMSGFDTFVHEYYERKITSWKGTYLILQNTSSEEEAFDKFFELLDEFLALTDEQKSQIMENAQNRLDEHFED